MPQIMNPNYYSPQYRNPMYNQFLPQGFQQEYQQPQFSGAAQNQTIPMYGRIVPSVESIAPNEVPMDGNAAFFPKQDLSEIYAKSWGADGKIYTRLYKLVLDADPNNLSIETEKSKFDLSDETTAAFMQRFDEIEKRLQSLSESIGKKTAAKTRQPKEEGDAE